jgi:hypothetical protein
MKTTKIHTQSNLRPLGITKSPEKGDQVGELPPSRQVHTILKKCNSLNKTTLTAPPSISHASTVMNDHVYAHIRVHVVRKCLSRKYPNQES